MYLGNCPPLVQISEIKSNINNHEERAAVRRTPRSIVVFYIAKKKQRYFEVLKFSKIKV